MKLDHALPLLEEPAAEAADSRAGADWALILDIALSGRQESAFLVADADKIRLKVDQWKRSLDGVRPFFGEEVGLGCRGFPDVCAHRSDADYLGNGLYCLFVTFYSNLSVLFRKWHFVPLVLL